MLGLHQKKVKKKKKIIFNLSIIIYKLNKV